MPLTNVQKLDHLRTARVVKTSHGVNPWRIVTASGQGIVMDHAFDHPHLGPTVISKSLSYARKRDAVAALDKLRADFARLVESEAAAHCE